MSDREQLTTRALHLSSCVLCGHTLIDHHTASLRCQHRSKPHWWSRLFVSTTEPWVIRGRHTDPQEAK